MIIRIQFMLGSGADIGKTVNQPRFLEICICYTFMNSIQLGNS